MVDQSYGRGNSPLRSHRSSASPRRDESQLEPRFGQRHGSGSEIQVYDYSRKQEPHIERGLGVPPPMLTKKSRVANLMLTQLAADILSIISQGEKSAEIIRKVLFELPDFSAF